MADPFRLLLACLVHDLIHRAAGDSKRLDQLLTDYSPAMDMKLPSEKVMQQIQGNIARRTHELFR
jgi:hypothetical protein